MEGARPVPAVSVNTLFDLLGNIYLFLEEVVGFDSIDNTGTELRAFSGVKYHQRWYFPQCVGSEFNAQWSNEFNAVFIPESALPYQEIIAHEFTHGIISNGSDLVYAFQSGALNESIADAIGVSFRIWLETNGYSRATSSSFWDMRNPGGKGRSLRNPKSVSDVYPDHYSDFVHLKPEEDDGGVHVNSSIMNQAFYLLASGGQHPRLASGPVVNGIGIEAATKIFAVAAAYILTSRAQFEDARSAFAQTAKMLFGRNTKEWIAVQTAMDAVGIPGDWLKPTIPTIPTDPESALVFWAIAFSVLGLLGVSLLMLKSRPKIAGATVGSSGTALMKGSQQDNKRVQSEGLLFGYLSALRGEERIPLSIELLESDEAGFWKGSGTGAY